MVNSINLIEVQSVQYLYYKSIPVVVVASITGQYDIHIVYFCTAQY